MPQVFIASPFELSVELIDAFEAVGGAPCNARFCLRRRGEQCQRDSLGNVGRHLTHSANRPVRKEPRGVRAGERRVFCRLDYLEVFSPLYWKSFKNAGPHQSNVNGSVFKCLQNFRHGLIHLSEGTEEAVRIQASVKERRSRHLPVEEHRFETRHRREMLQVLKTVEISAPVAHNDCAGNRLVGIRGEIGDERGERIDAVRQQRCIAPAAAENNIHFAAAGCLDEGGRTVDLHIHAVFRETLRENLRKFAQHVVVGIHIGRESRRSAFLQKGHHPKTQHGTEVFRPADRKSGERAEQSRSCGRGSYSPAGYMKDHCEEMGNSAPTKVRGRAADVDAEMKDAV